MTPPLSVRAVRVPVPQGDLFARIWSTAGEGAELRAEIPIVLFHDSLGCVELWRSFPERLCISTGRTVVAYRPASSATSRRGQRSAKASLASRRVRSPAGSSRAR